MFSLLLPGNHRDEQVLTGVLTRLVNEECGDKKFVGIKNGSKDGFILLLFDGKVILQDFVDKLNHKYHIMLGTPEDTPHKCPKHLSGLLNKHKVPGNMCALVKGLLKMNYMAEAVDATKSILRSRKLFFRLVCLCL